jgi:hypothetical protein
MCGRPPRWQQDPNPTIVALLDLFDEPIPDLPGVPAAFVDLLRQGMRNDPAARPGAARLRDLLAGLELEREFGRLPLNAVRASMAVPRVWATAERTQPDRPAGGF